MMNEASTSSYIKGIVHPKLQFYHVVANLLSSVKHKERYSEEFISWYSSQWGTIQHHLHTGMFGMKQQAE